MERAPTKQPLSRMQLLVAELLGLGLTAPEVARELSIKTDTVRFHVKGAADKIASDFPAQLRVVLWARGATADVLTGATIKLEIMARSRPTSGRVVQLSPSH